MAPSWLLLRQYPAAVSRVFCVGSKRNPTLSREQARRELTPTPIPAFAPVDSPESLEVESSDRPADVHTEFIKGVMVAEPVEVIVV